LASLLLRAIEKAAENSVYIGFLALSNTKEIV